MAEADKVGKALRKATHRAETLGEMWIEEKVKIRNLSAQYLILTGEMPADDPWTLQGKKFDDNYRMVLDEQLANIRVIPDGTKDY